jgi:hypothetical protein
MKTSNEKEIGLNRAGVTLVGVGLSSTLAMTLAGVPSALILLPVLVTVAGVVICFRWIIDDR